MREKIKQHGVSILLVLVAVMLLVQVKIVGDLQELQGQVQMQTMGPDSVRNMLSAELSGMQYRLEESMKQQASALSSFQWETGKLNADNLSVPLIVSVTPKEVSGDTRVQVQIPDGESVVLEKNGVTYTGTVRVGLFQEIGMRVLIERGGVITVEEPVGYTWSLRERYLPELYGSLWYAAPKTGGDGAVTFQGSAHVGMLSKEAAEGVFRSITLRCTLDGKEVWNRPLTQEEGIADFPEEGYYERSLEFEGVEIDPGQTLDLTLLATDGYGLIHHYRLPESFLSGLDSEGARAEFYMAAVYKADGTLIYQR